MKLDHTISPFSSKHDHPHSPSRRSFLFGSLGMLTLKYFEYPYLSIQVPSPSSTLEALLQALGSRKYVRDIARSFLSSDEGIAFDRDKSFRKLSSDLTPVESVSVQMRRLIESDFLNGNSVRVEGWILSRTEVELCALSAT